MIYIIGIQRRSVNRFLLSFPYSVIAGQDTDHHDDTKSSHQFHRSHPVPHDRHGEK